MNNRIMTKRVYDTPEKTDGFRVLVDRLWPRGIAKARAGIDLWLKEVAPSTELRKWYGHDPGKWAEFKKRYFRELDKNLPVIARLQERIRRGGGITLLYASRENILNNAAALKEYLIRK